MIWLPYGKCHLYQERIAVLKGLENQRIDDFMIAYTTTRYFFILINHPYFGYNTEGGI